MWKKAEKAKIRRIIEAAKDQGTPFKHGHFRLDCPEYVELMSFSLTAFPRLFDYMIELEEALKEAGIETKTMKRVKERPEY